MPLALLVLTAALPPLIEQTGKCYRKWLQARAAKVANEDELRKLRERVEALERERKWG